jgi:Cdc6-like AAA superfamily ATPase
MNQYETTRVYPLYSYKAELILKDGLYYFELDLDSRKTIDANIPSEISRSAAYLKLNSLEMIDFHFISKFANIIQTTNKTYETEALFDFPDLLSSRKLNRLLKKPFKPSEQFVPIGVLAVVERENQSFTTLHELKTLCQQSAFSAPLKTLFDVEKIGEEREKKGIICEELNQSQLDAIALSNQTTVSLISGPPGTGKSFTIANLATEKVSKGHSVLIASKNKEALDVIHEKIDTQLQVTNLCFNAARGSHFSEIKDFLKYVLGRSFKSTYITFSEVERSFKKYQDFHDAHIELERDLQRQFDLEKTYHERFETDRLKNTSTQFQQRIYQSRSRLTIPIWEKLDDYYKRIASNRKKAIQLIQLVRQYMLESEIYYHRAELRAYQSFLKARNKDRKKELAKSVDYETVLKAFPVWLVKANDISNTLPLQNELFDVLIIDEASQCDLPSMLPLLQRAKKAIIVGDTQQLSHISFLPKATERMLRQAVRPSHQHLCRHRDYSIMHLGEDVLDPQCQVHLTEHFRSQFPIIAFSHSEIYHKSLDILTKRPVSVADHIKFERTNGKRESGKNKTEIEAILKAIRTIIQQEQKLPLRLKTSIGVLSPFRDQVDAILQSIITQIETEHIKNHHILVGTAHHFQGNERDTMFISLVVTDACPGGSYTFLNRKDVFNVSITRAKNLQYIFYSFDPKKLSFDSTLDRFFRFYQDDRNMDQGKSTHDAFCLEVQHHFNKKGLNSWTNFSISGVSIDLLIQVEDQFFGIDLIGFPGEMVDYYSLERYKMIERGKIKLFPLPYPLWAGDPATCLAALDQLIEITEVSIDSEVLLEPEPDDVTEEEPIPPADAPIDATREMINATFRIEKKVLENSLMNLRIFKGKVIVASMKVSCEDAQAWLMEGIYVKRGYHSLNLEHWMLHELSTLFPHIGEPEKLIINGNDVSDAMFSRCRKAAVPFKVVKSYFMNE